MRSTPNKVSTETAVAIRSQHAAAKLATQDPAALVAALARQHRVTPSAVRKICSGRIHPARICIDLSDDEYLRLSKVAEARGCTLAELAQEALARL